MPLRAKMLAVINEVKDEAAERDELIECIAIALLTQKNLFVLGDTGQAKSFVINEFRRRIEGAKQFERLLSKQADEEQLFGRIDLSSLIPGNPDMEILANDPDYQSCLTELRALKQNCADVDVIDAQLKKLDALQRTAFALHGNKPKLITSGKIPDSHIVFLDEIFKANDGILNSLLTALNERRYTNEGYTIDIPVISFFAASNEIPNLSDPAESILRPLYDRFDLKVVTQYIQNRENRLRILSRKQNDQSGPITAFISLEELYSMQREVSAIKVPVEINELMDDILCELRGHKIHVSDRKLLNFYPLAQAKTWLSGRDIVEDTDLSIIKYYFWTTPDEMPVIRKVLDKFCLSPLQEELKKTISLADESYADFGDNVKANPTNAMIKLRGELVRIYRMLMKMETGTTDTEGKNAIAKAIDDIEEMSKEAHIKTRFTYAPLSELQELL